MRFWSIVGQASIQTARASGPSTMERSRGLPPPLGIQAPRPRPGSREVEPDKAVEHRGDAVVHDRPEAHGGKNLEIRHRHLTGQQEGHGASEQAEEEQGAAECLEDTGESRSEEHTSELQSLAYLVCRLLLEKKKSIINELYNCHMLRSSLNL